MWRLALHVRVPPPKIEKANKPNGHNSDVKPAEELRKKKKKKRKICFFLGKWYQSETTIANYTSHASARNETKTWSECRGRRWRTRCVCLLVAVQVLTHTTLTLPPRSRVVLFFWKFISLCVDVRYGYGGCCVVCECIKCVKMYELNFLTWPVIVRAYERACKCRTIHDIGAVKSIINDNNNTHTGERERQNERELGIEKGIYRDWTAASGSKHVRIIQIHICHRMCHVSLVSHCRGSKNFVYAFVSVLFRISVSIDC